MLLFFYLFFYYILELFFLYLFHLFLITLWSLLWLRLLGSLLALVGTEEVAEAHLPLIIPAKAVDAARLHASDSVMLATNDLDEVVAFVRIEVLHSNWSGLGDLVPNAQLTMVIHSPGEDLAGFVDIEGVKLATEDIYRVLGSDLLQFENKVRFLFYFCF